MEYGIGILLVIAITGGIIAYIGDKLGSKIGKKRITLFGLRPKHTAIVVNVLTGILIATATIGVTAILSNNVRTALFGMEKLRIEMETLNEEVKSKNIAIQNGKKELEEKIKELQTLNAEVLIAREELDAAEIARQEMAGKLISVETAYREAGDKLRASEGEIRSLEQTKALLAGQVTDLEVMTKRLESNLSVLREGNVLFRVGEVLAGAVVKEGLDETEAELTLANILHDTNGLILKRIGSTENRNMIYVDPENVKEVVKQLVTAKDRVLVRMVASGNVIYGEPAVVKLVAQPYQKIYKKGELVYETTVFGGKKAQEAILTFLHEVNGQAKAKGVLPNPVTGEVGSLPGEELYLRIDELRDLNEAVTIQAIAKEDTYNDGPIPITLRIIPIR